MEAPVEGAEKVCVIEDPPPYSRNASGLHRRMKPDGLGRALSFSSWTVTHALHANISRNHGQGEDALGLRCLGVRNSAMFHKTTAAWKGRKVLAVFRTASRSTIPKSSHVVLEMPPRILVCTEAAGKFSASSNEGTSVCSVERQHPRRDISLQELAYLSGPHSLGVGCYVFLFDATIAASSPAKAITTSR